MNCECIAKVNEKLKPHGYALAVSFGAETLHASLNLKTVKIERSRAGRINPGPDVAPTYCPFCGVHTGSLTLAAQP